MVQDIAEAKFAAVSGRAERYTASRSRVALNPGREISPDSDLEISPDSVFDNLGAKDRELETGLTGWKASDGGGELR